LFLIFLGLNLVVKDPLLENQPKIKGGYGRIIAVFLWYVGLLYAIWLCLTENHHWIVFKEDLIYVPSDLKLKFNRRQFRVVVNYNDILDLSFITSKKNSKNKTIRDESSQTFALRHHYLVILKKNKKKERILLDYYSKKQKFKILEELERRLEDCGNLIDTTNARTQLEKLGPR